MGKASQLGISFFWHLRLFAAIDLGFGPGNLEKIMFDSERRRYIAGHAKIHLAGREDGTSADRGGHYASDDRSDAAPQHAGRRNDDLRR